MQICHNIFPYYSLSMNFNTLKPFPSTVFVMEQVNGTLHKYHQFVFHKDFTVNLTYKLIPIFLFHYFSFSNTILVMDNFDRNSFSLPSKSISILYKWILL